MEKVGANFDVLNNNSLNTQAAQNSDTTDEQLIFEQDDSNSKNLDDLELQFEAAQDEQGFLGKLWNGFKNLTGLGLSSNDVQDKLEQYENGEITYDEAASVIEEYKTKQDGAVDLIANTATGLAVAGVSVATGGTGAILIGLGVGAGAKAGLKTVDRATNDIEGDALDSKEILKDGITGAVDGVTSALTAGMVSVPTAGATVMNTAKQGLVQGAKAGAITGAATGATQYTTDCAFDDDKEFALSGLLATTTQNAITGGVFGGITGGIGGAISQNNFNNTVTITHNNELQKEIDNAFQAKRYLDNFNEKNKEIAITSAQEYSSILNKLEGHSASAQDLTAKFDSQIDEASEQIYSAFKGNKTIDSISARPKGQNSVFSKLAKKEINGSANLTTMDNCYDAIGDALGLRIQMNSLDSDTSSKIVEKMLKKNNINATFDDFVKYVSGEELQNKEIENALSNVSKDIIDSLKQKQSQGVVDQLVKGIKKGKVNITEINNYGSELTSYFTDAQIQQIADAYDYAISKGIFENDSAFKILNDNPVLDINDTDVTDGIGNITSKSNSDTKIKVKQKTKGAQKESGYASTQANTKHKLKDGTIANGELQIRGTKVNEFAEVEHIPYDIRSGKIYKDDPKYADIYDLITKMEDVDYDSYNKYLSDVYKTLRLQELGLLPDSAIMPNIKNYMSNSNLNDEALKMIDMNGLIEIAKKGH